MSDQLLYHIAAESEWKASDEKVYTPSGFEDEGFIHLSYSSQLLPTYHRYYDGKAGLVLLVIRLSAESAKNLINEDLTGRGEAFPHLYQTLVKGDVTAVHPVPSENGAPLKEFFSRVMASES